MAFWLDAAISLVFPPRCLGCQLELDSASPPLFCKHCYPQLDFIGQDTCHRCGERTINGVQLCADCRKNKRFYDQARAALVYKEGPLSEALHAFKYRGDFSTLASFAFLVRHLPPGLSGEGFELILPVPLHPGRLRERGFNQSFLLARAFFPEAGKRINNTLLIRNRHTDSQLAMSGSQRRKNLYKAFTVTDKQQVKGKRVLLVDDVFTTGSTINECSRVLKAAGAQYIAAITLARVVSV